MIELSAGMECSHRERRLQPEGRKLRAPYYH
jgi:hypothetical protein